MELRHYLMFLLAGLNGVDAGATAVLTMRPGVRELNPLMAPLLAVHPLLFIAVKLAVMLFAARLFLGSPAKVHLAPLVGLTLAYLGIVLYTVLMAKMCV